MFGRGAKRDDVVELVMMIGVEQDGMNDALCWGWKRMYVCCTGLKV